MSIEDPSAWSANDMTEARIAEVSVMVDRLEKILPHDGIMFHSRTEIENLTDEQAKLVIYYARRTLALQLLHQERHEHMSDDCGDYLDAATSLWNEIFYNAELQEGRINMTMLKEVLLSDLRACDGDFRFAIYSEELLETFGY